MVFNYDPIGKDWPLDVVRLVNSSLRRNQKKRPPTIYEACNSKYEEWLSEGFNNPIDFKLCEGFGNFALYSFIFMA